MKKINLENLDLETEINNILKSYNQESFDKLEEKADNIGKRAVNKLKNTTGTYTVRTGKYNQSWTMKSESGVLTFNKIVHNKKYYRLTHLLENGHATINGGRTRAFTHIEPVQREATEDLLKAAKESYGGGKK